MSAPHAGQAVFLSVVGYRWGAAVFSCKSCTLIWVLKGPVASAPQEEQSNFYGSLKLESLINSHQQKALNPDSLMLQICICLDWLISNLPWKKFLEVGVVPWKSRPIPFFSSAEHLFAG